MNERLCTRCGKAGLTGRNRVHDECLSVKSSGVRVAVSTRAYCGFCESEQVVTPDTRNPLIEVCFGCGRDVNRLTLNAPAPVIVSELKGFDEAPLWSELRMEKREVTILPVDMRAEQVRRRVSKAEARRARKNGAGRAAIAKAVER